LYLPAAPPSRALGVSRFDRFQGLRDSPEQLSLLRRSADGEPNEAARKAQVCEYTGRVVVKVQHLLRS
jgi:hypothetical protein